jgi:beta-glucosidase
MHEIKPRLAATVLLAAGLCGSVAANAAELNIYAGAPMPAWHVVAADADSRKILSGDSVVVPNTGASAGRVMVSKSTRQQDGDALTLELSDAGYGGLRVELAGGAAGAALDLRPYLARGVLALDLKVEQLAKGGINFTINCGKDCSRTVPYLVPARAMQGKGWQHLAFAMSCFAREGDDFSAVTQPFALDAGGNARVAVANIKFQAEGQPNASCPDYKTVSVTSQMLNEWWSIAWWQTRHEQKLQEIATARKNSPRHEIVFIGDSITQGWEKAGASVWASNYQQYHALNLGFSGDRTETTLWRLLHGEIDGIRPKVAVLMLGTNNTGHRQEDPRTTAAGIKCNLDELRRRLPDTRILLLAIFPRDEQADSAQRRLNDQVNAIIAGYADQRHIWFLDINRALLNPDGTLSRAIMPDLLHPNQQGYEIWAKAMAPALQRLLQPATALTGGKPE